MKKLLSNIFIGQNGWIISLICMSLALFFANIIIYKKSVALETANKRIETLETMLMIEEPVDADN